MNVRDSSEMRARPGFDFFIPYKPNSEDMRNENWDENSIAFHFKTRSQKVNIRLNIDFLQIRNPIVNDHQGMSPRT